MLFAERSFKVAMRIMVLMALFCSYVLLYCNILNHVQKDCFSSYKKLSPSDPHFPSAGDVPIRVPST